MPKYVECVSMCSVYKDVCLSVHGVGQLYLLHFGLGTMRWLPLFRMGGHCVSPSGEGKFAQAESVSFLGNEEWLSAWVCCPDCPKQIFP